MSFPNPSNAKPTTTGERLQKLIALAGITSRRDAEDLIRDGLVTINGKTAKLGDKGVLGVDAIKVKGKLIHSSPNKVYYLIHKPKNVIAMMNEDEEGRPTLKDLYKKQIKERVFTVGRMDFTGEGAMILTNDGEVAQQLVKSPTLMRRYQIKVHRHPSNEDLARLARGGRVERVSFRPNHVRLVQTYTRNALVEISFEGQSGVDLRQFFEQKGLIAERVIRVGIGHLSVEKIPSGGFKRIEASSIQALLAQPELAQRQIDSKIKSPRVQTISREEPRAKKSEFKSVKFAPVKPSSPTPFTTSASTAGAATSPWALSPRKSPARTSTPRSGMKPAFRSNQKPAIQPAFKTKSRGPRFED